MWSFTAGASQLGYVTPLQQERCYGASHAVDGTLFVVGGYGLREPLTSVESLDLTDPQARWVSSNEYDGPAAMAVPRWG